MEQVQHVEKRGSGTKGWGSLMAHACSWQPGAIWGCQEAPAASAVDRDARLPSIGATKEQNSKKKIKGWRF